jgi:CubicO group peptidase (beta-lactamase class C family)
MKQIWIVAAILTLLATGPLGCGTLSSLDYASTGDEVTRLAYSGDVKAEADALAQPLIDSGHTPGIIVGVLMPDRTRRYFAYGVRDKATGARPNGHTLFPIGSVSKGFVAVAVASQVQTGALSWNDTLADCLPADIPLSADARKITLVQLASHTAGLPRQPNTMKVFVQLIDYFFTGNNFYRHMDRPYLLGYLAEFEAPDTIRPIYSNIGYAYLSHVLELRTGQPACILVESTVLKPLGLQQTGYDPTHLPGWDVRARGYAGDEPRYMRRGSPVPEWQNTEALRSSVGLYSSAEDLLTFASAHLYSTGNATRDAALRDTLQPRADPPPFSPALAWFLDTRDGQTLAYQLGVMAGYTIYLGIDLRHKTSVVVLQNSVNFTDHVGHKLLLRMARAADRPRSVTEATTNCYDYAGAR